MEKANQEQINILLGRTEKIEQQAEVLAKEMEQLVNGSGVQGETDESEILQKLKSDNDKLRYRINILKNATEKEITSHNQSQVIPNTFPQNLHCPSLQSTSNKTLNACDNKVNNSTDLSDDKAKLTEVKDTPQVLSYVETPNCQESSSSCLVTYCSNSMAIETNSSNNVETNCSSSMGANSSKIQETNPSKSQETNFSQNLEINSSNSQEIEETNSSKNQETNSSKSQETHSSKSQETNSSKSQETNSTKCQETNSSKSPQTTPSENQETNSSKSPQTNPSENQETNSSKSLEANSFKSLETNSFRSKENNSSKIKEISSSKSQETNSCKSHEANSSKNLGHNSSKNLETNISKSQGNNYSNSEETTSTGSEGPCFLCFQPTSHNCSNCIAWSCPDHLASHRPASYCLPFAVRYREEVGRYAVATRDIKAMEIVLEDMPAVTGPNYETEAVCLECIGRVDGSILCLHCNLPLCSEACRDGPNHGTECAVFAKLDKKVNVEQYGPGTIAHEYGCITVLRLLSLKDKDPETWQRLGYLMDHDKERRLEMEYWRMFQRNVVEFLRVGCGLGELYSEDEVHRAIGLLRTNAAHLEMPNMTESHTSGKALYPTFSFLSHSCMSNATYTVMPGDARLVLKAQRDISSGEEITIQYISFLHGNIQRRKDIRACWFFTCSCPRCEDPSELGTGLSASLCTSCGGNVLPGNNDVDTDTWICRSCGESVPTSEVEAVVKQCEGELWDTVETDVKAYDRMLKEYSAKFTTNHFLILMIKKNLSRALNQQPQVNREMAERNVALVEHFINVYSVVDPGYTKWRAIMLYDLIKIRLALTDRAFSAKEIPKEEFIDRLKINITDLEFVVKALAIEPAESKEGRILMLARKALSSANECMRFSSWL